MHFANAANADLNSDLIKAAEAGNTADVKQLIGFGADVNAKDNDGKTALAWAAQKDHTGTVKVLIEAGADVNSRNNLGSTPLINVAGRGQTEMARVLIEAGADVNSRNNLGRTALMAAAVMGYTEMADVLIEAGADVNAEQKDGQTALMLSAKENRAEIFDMLKQAGAHGEWTVAEDINAESPKAAKGRARGGATKPEMSETLAWILAVIILGILTILGRIAAYLERRYRSVQVFLAAAHVIAYGVRGLLIGAVTGLVIFALSASGGGGFVYALILSPLVGMPFGITGAVIGLVVGLVIGVRKGKAVYPGTNLLA